MINLSFKLVTVAAKNSYIGVWAFYILFLHYDWVMGDRVGGAFENCASSGLSTTKTPTSEMLRCKTSLISVLVILSLGR